jgi:Dimerisation domain
MKLGVVPDNLIERLALLTGLLPPGIFESWFGIMLARTIMVGTKLDIFEALASEPLTVSEVAKRCGTHLRGTEKLLNALVGLECLRVKGERYALRRSLRAWILKDGKYSFRDQIRMALPVGAIEFTARRGPVLDTAEIRFAGDATAVAWCHVRDWADSPRRAMRAWHRPWSAQRASSHSRELWRTSGVMTLTARRATLCPRAGRPGLPFAAW